LRAILVDIGEPLKILKRTHELIKIVVKNTKKHVELPKNSYYLRPKDFS